MLSSLMFHFIVSAVCYFFGFCFYEYISKEHKNKSLITYIISGLISITLIGQIISLFAPLNRINNIIILILPGALTLFKLKKIKLQSRIIIQNFTSLSWQSIFLLAGIYFLIVIINSGPIIMDDTGSYHIQMIKWIEEYGTVPGIANLHERYGFNSSWFISIASFNFFPHKMHSYSALNGLLSVWFCYYLIEKGFKKDALPSIKIASVLTIIMALISWPIVRGNAATANYDSITMLVIAVLFIEIIEKNIQKREAILPTEWVLWPIYLLTVRIINFPVLMLALIPLANLIKRKDWRNLSTIAALAMALIVPFICRNVVLSGYPFYPSPAFNFFNVDWKTPKEVLDRLLYFITYYNRVNNGFMDIEATARLGNFKWIKPWFQYMFGYDKVIFLPGITGILVYLLTALRYAKEGALKLVIPGITIIIALVSWFLIAPDPRFIYGFLITGNFFLFTFIFKKGITQKFMFVLMLGLASSVILFSTLKLLNNDYRNMVFASPVPQPAVKKVIINGIELNIPEKVEGNWNNRCYDTNLPCLYMIYPGLEPRGIDIKDGFRIRK